MQYLIIKKSNYCNVQLIWIIDHESQIYLISATIALITAAFIVIAITEIDI